MEIDLILIGSSLGAVALFEALLSLASTLENGLTPLVDTAVFISLPQAPTNAQWEAIRNAVGRRVVNAYCKRDMVLAGVGRLHEVFGGANLGAMAGLEPSSKEVPGIENVDLGNIVEGHFDIAPKMKAILEEIGVDC